MMSGNQQELEVKLYLVDMPAFQERLEAQGAKLQEARVHEINLRFDTPDGKLGRAAQVLRLRQDSRARMTFKGPGESMGGVYARQEIEFSVSDFQASRSLFEALGYQISLMYEKYRTTYVLEDQQVTLDEMPYGNFIEIEGPQAQGIHALAEKMGLNWETRILHSYTALFEQLQQKRGFTFRDLSFENFSNLNITPDDLGVTPADLS
jgi:adenylate cyclase class 2